MGKNCGSHQTTTAAGRRLKEKKKGMRLRWGWVGSNSRRGSSSGGVVLDFNPMANYYTLEVERYGEWVKYDFMPNANNTVYTKPSFGRGKTIPTEEARRLWSALIRKGWSLQGEPNF